MPASAINVCTHHHERLDGHGCPFGLAVDQISLHARMGAICDVYEALPPIAATRLAAIQVHMLIALPEPQLA